MTSALQIDDITPPPPPMSLMKHVFGTRAPIPSAVLWECVYNGECLSICSRTAGWTWTSRSRLIERWLMSGLVVKHDGKMGLPASVWRLFCLTIQACGGRKNSRRVQVCVCGSDRTHTHTPWCLPGSISHTSAQLQHLLHASQGLSISGGFNEMTLALDEISGFLFSTLSLKCIQEF